MEMLQAEVEACTLKALYDLSNMGGEWVDAAYVAGVIQNGISAQRTQMALRVLEHGRLVRGQHNAISGSKYQISESGYKQVEADLSSTAEPDDAPMPEAPASDRVVGFDHNSRDYREVRQKVSDLQVQLATANDLGDLTPRSAAVASDEVAALGRTMDAEYFRPAELWARAKMTLDWIGREAAAAVVGAAASGLLALLATLLGFPLV